MPTWDTTNYESKKYRTPKLHRRLKLDHEEQNKTCKLCGLRKHWIFLKRNGMQKKYADLSGRQWNSTICPDCSPGYSRKSYARRHK